MSLHRAFDRWLAPTLWASAAVWVGYMLLYVVRV